MTGKQKVLKTMAAEVGYLEKQSDGQLDEKSGNAGSGGYTKYARDMFGPGPVPQWDKVFIDWCFRQAFGEKTAKRLLGDYAKQPEGSGPGSDQEQGGYFNQPQTGDLVVFRVSGIKRHVGMVDDLDDDNIYTIEGAATSDSDLGVLAAGVCRKTHPRTSPSIEGYVRPDWKHLPAAGFADYERQMIISEEAKYEVPAARFMGAWTEEVIEV